VVSDVVVNSEYVKNSVANITKLRKKEPTVIYHGIEPESKLFSTCNSKNIAIVGRLSHEKGVDLAIKSIQFVLASEPQAQLWIIGDGNEKDNLLRLTSELGIENSVKFLGFVTDVESLLVQCSMLLLTSRWEGFGLVLLEAMKLKIPCLAFDHTAANEIIIENVSGFLIPEMSIELLAKKIVSLLKNPELSRQMGENGNILLNQKFTLKQSIDQFEKIILSN
jgi:glycosyltransferase involved in cell wall biosynthesis